MSNSIEALDELFRARLYLYFHEDMLSDKRTQVECDFMCENLGLKNGHSLLDLACGHGRHATALAKREIKVTAWDLNQEFIQLARKASKEQGLEIDYQCRDILTLEYHEEFDAIILLFNTLGFFSRAEALDLMKRMSKALKSGGKLFLDIKNRDHILKELVPFSLVERGEDMMVDRLSFDPKTGTTLNQRTYLKDGKRYEVPFSMTLFNYTDIDRFSKMAGLSITKDFGHWDGRAFDQNSRRIILILEK